MRTTPWLEGAGSIPIGVTFNSETDQGLLYVRWFDPCQDEFYHFLISMYK
jgi:hypothetical protein